MYDNEIGKTLALTIRLEDTAGADVTGKVNADLTVKKSDRDDTGLVTIASGDRSLNELGEGDYTLHIAASIIDTLGFFRVKVSCSGCVTKQYVVDVTPTKLDVYFKSTGDDSLGDGSLTKPYKTLGQCKTHIASRPGFTIHVLDAPANVAGNKDQSFTVQVKIKGYGFDWQSVTPTSFNIGVSTNASGVVLEDLNIIKIFLDSSSFNTVMRRCKDVSYINRFSEAGVFEDCVFSAAISGGGTDFGKRAKWIRCIFKENVDVNITQEGGIFKNCVFEKNLDTGVAQLTIYDNCTVHGTLTGDNNTAFAGKVTFRNVIVDGAATIDGKKYVFVGGMIRGALNLNSNSVDCLFWITRIKGTITDGGTGNEILNEGAFGADISALALEASVQAVKTKTDNLPADPASESNVSAVGAAVVVVDGVVDAIKVQTDKLTFNAADRILSDLREVNDADVTLADLAGLTRDQYFDFFNKEVLSRTGGEPSQYKLGTGGNSKTIDVDYVVIGSKKKADKETVV
jgi:hypothetical protein